MRRPTGLLPSNSTCDSDWLMMTPLVAGAESRSSNVRPTINGIPAAAKNPGPTEADVHRPGDDDITVGRQLLTAVNPVVRVVEERWTGNAGGADVG